MLAAHFTLHCVLKIDSNKLESEGKKAFCFPMKKCRRVVCKQFQFLYQSKAVQTVHSRPHMQINWLTTSAHMAHMLHTSG